MITFYTKFPQISSGSPEQKAYYANFLNSNVIIDAKGCSHYFPVNPGGPLTIKYVFRGEEYYLCGNTKYRVTSNNFLIFNERQKYSSYINSDETTESFSVFFKPEYVRIALSVLLTDTDSLLENPFYSKTSQQKVNFIERIYPAETTIISVLEMIKNGMRNKIYSEAGLNEMLFFLIEKILLINRNLYSEIEKVSSVKKTTKVELYRRLNIVRDYIESCYSENLTLLNLSNASCMCEHHMLREFKKYYGLTPYQYLLNVRLNNAKRLLAETEKSVSQISAETGFEYLSSFSEVFIKRFKTTPSSYRKKSI